MENWIDINESQPVYNVQVLVCQHGQDNSIQICRLESITERKDKDGVKKDFNWLEGKHGYETWYYDVTHWMPLPSPPHPNKK